MATATNGTGLDNLQFVRYEKKGRVALVTLNRPEVLNAYHYPMLRELAAVWHDFREDPEVWTAILSGAGRAFCAGADLVTPRGREEPEPPSLHYATIELYKPVIAAVHGYCFGGGMSMALACDIRIASEDALFGYPQPRIGLQSQGGPQRLPRMTFFGKAMELLLLGEHLPAQDALKWGLVNRVVPREQLVDAATEMAERINANSPVAVRGTKEAVHKGMRLLDLREAIQVGRLLAQRTQLTEDYKEGRRAFMEKRKPVFPGR
ncbi:MAG: enoyl-CoA hydratase/isomerase family protein [Chloroflexi bacterium]|nr:enoyl-CoA hydratase/isomerase family protein [Chloroflexota bacterium]